MTAPWCADGRLTLDAAALEYRCVGPPPTVAGTLVLLHEGLGCAALWRDFPDALVQATGWGALAYSRAGYGRSSAADLPRPLDYMTREAEDVLPQVLDGLDIGYCILVGHSDGATIAAIHAGRVRDARVRGLVLMAPHFFTEDCGLAEIARAAVAFRDGDLRARMAKYHDDPEATFRGWNDAWLDPGFRDWTVTDVLEGIACPVLAVQGREDQYGTLAQIDVLKDRCAGPVETLILDDCRHAPFADRPDAVIPAVTEFCAQVTARVPAMTRAGA